MIFKNSQDTIEFNNITIPTNIKKIGIKLSGGADSAVVCYMLVKYLKEERPDIILHPITSVSINKPYQQIFAERVVKKISDLLDYKNFGEHFCADARAATSEQYIEDQRKLLFWLYDNNKIDMHFNGISAIASNFDAPELYEELDELPDKADRFKTNEKKNQVAGKAFSPLINTDKKGIAEYYINLGILEELFPLTRSCEKTTTDFSQHCGNCWFCKERYWAFGRYV